LLCRTSKEFLIAKGNVVHEAEAISRGDVEESDSPLDPIEERLRRLEAKRNLAVKAPEAIPTLARIEETLARLKEIIPQSLSDDLQEIITIFFKIKSITAKLFSSEPAKDEYADQKLLIELADDLPKSIYQFLEGKEHPKSIAKISREERMTFTSIDAPSQNAIKSVNMDSSAGRVVEDCFQQGAFLLEDDSQGQENVSIEEIPQNDFFSKLDRLKKDCCIDPVASSRSLRDYLLRSALVNYTKETQQRSKVHIFFLSSLFDEYHVLYNKNILPLLAQLSKFDLICIIEDIDLHGFNWQNNLEENDIHIFNQLIRDRKSSQQWQQAIKGVYAKKAAEVCFNSSNIAHDDFPSFKEQKKIPFRVYRDGIRRQLRIDIGNVGVDNFQIVISTEAGLDALLNQHLLEILSIYWQLGYECCYEHPQGDVAISHDSSNYSVQPHEVFLYSTQALLLQEATKYLTLSPVWVFHEEEKNRLLEGLYNIYDAEIVINKHLYREEAREEYRHRQTALKEYPQRKQAMQEYLHRKHLWPLLPEYIQQAFSTGKNSEKWQSKEIYDALYKDCIEYLKKIPTDYYLIILQAHQLIYVTEMADPIQQQLLQSLKAHHGGKLRRYQQEWTEYTTGSDLSNIKPSMIETPLLGKMKVFSDAKGDRFPVNPDYRLEDIILAEEAAVDGSFLVYLATSDPVAIAYVTEGSQLNKSMPFNAKSEHLNDITKILSINGNSIYVSKFLEKEDDPQINIIKMNQFICQLIPANAEHNSILNLLTITRPNLPESGHIFIRGNTPKVLLSPHIHYIGCQVNIEQFRGKEGEKLLMLNNYVFDFDPENFSMQDARTLYAIFCDFPQPTHRLLVQSAKNDSSPAIILLALHLCTNSFSTGIFPLKTVENIFKQFKQIIQRRPHIIHCFDDLRYLMKLIVYFLQVRLERNMQTLGANLYFESLPQNSLSYDASNKLIENSSPMALYNSLFFTLLPLGVIYQNTTPELSDSCSSSSSSSSALSSRKRSRAVTITKNPDNFFDSQCFPQKASNQEDALKLIVFEREIAAWEKRISQKRFIRYFQENKIPMLEIIKSCNHLSIFYLLNYYSLYLPSGGYASDSDDDYSLSYHRKVEYMAIKKFITQAIDRFSSLFNKLPLENTLQQDWIIYFATDKLCRFLDKVQINSGKNELYKATEKLYFFRQQLCMGQSNFLKGSIVQWRDYIELLPVRINTQLKMAHSFHKPPSYDEFFQGAEQREYTFLKKLFLEFRKLVKACLDSPNMQAYYCPMDDDVKGGVEVGHDQTYPSLAL